MKFRNIYEKTIKNILAPAMAFVMIGSFAGCKREVEVDEDAINTLISYNYNLDYMEKEEKSKVIESINESLEDIIPRKVQYIDDYDMTCIAENVLTANIYNSIYNEEMLNITLDSPNKYLMNDFVTNDIVKVLNAYNIDSITFSNTDMKNDVSLVQLKKLIGGYIDEDGHKIKNIKLYNCKNIDVLEQLGINSSIYSFNIVNNSFKNNQSIDLSNFVYVHDLYIENNPDIIGLPSFLGYSVLKNIVINDYNPEFVKDDSVIKQEQNLINLLLNLKLSDAMSTSITLNGVDLPKNITIDNEYLDVTFKDCWYNNDSLNLNLNNAYDFSIINNGYNNKSEITINIENNNLKYDNEVTIKGEKSDKIKIINKTNEKVLVKK